MLNRAGFTLGIAGGTVVAAEEDKWVVHSDSLLNREALNDGLIGGFWGLCSYDANTVTDSVNVGIHSDIRRIVENREYYFSRLDAYSRKCHNCREIIRNF